MTSVSSHYPEDFITSLETVTPAQHLRSCRNIKPEYCQLRLLHSALSSVSGYRVWSARLEMCQWRRETLDKESIWDEARSTSLSRW